MTNRKIDEIMESLDEISSAEAPSFFYTRLKAKMLVQHNAPAPIQNNSWVLKPVFAFAAFIVLVAINIFVITMNNNKDENNITGSDNIQAIAADYNMPDANSLYDIALEK